MAYVDETGAPTGNADGRNPEGKRGWQWVMVKALVTVFLHGLSHSAAAAMELLGAFAGNRCPEDWVYVVSDRFSDYIHLPIKQHQLCWVHLIRDLTAITERKGASGDIGGQLLELQRQLFAHCHHCKEGLLIWPELQHAATRSAWRSRPPCCGWWILAVSGTSERRWPRRCSPAGSCCSAKKLSGRSWRHQGSSRPTTPPSGDCGRR